MAPLAKAYIIHGECGDYYCGCGEGHIIGVTLNPDEVADALKAAQEISHSYGGDRWYPDYTSVKATEFELGFVYPRDLSDVTRQNTDRTQGPADSLGFGSTPT